MKFLPRWFLVLIPLAGALVSLRAAEPAAEKVLFDGKTLDGWVVESNGQFSVENGLLRVNRGTGWLRSVDTYGDFTLILEFRFLEPKANSGIFVRTLAASRKDANGWPENGYQVQCMDTFEGDHPLGTLILYGAPPFEQKIDAEALKKAYKPTGEWHHEEIICRGETLSVVLNGFSVTKVTNVKNLTGHIGIQGEKGLLEFRKITVKTSR